MKIYFAGDHAGFELKKELMGFVRSLGHEVEDLGPHAYDANDDYPDYVIPLARRVAEKGEKGEMGERGEKGGEVRGIVVAGSGQGEIIAMNRIRGARAALLCPCHRTQMNPSSTAELTTGHGADAKTQIDADTETQMNADEMEADKHRCSVGLDLIKVSRAHNDSNILAIGARFTTLDEAKKGITVWLETPFSGEERHIRRLKKIETLSVQ